MSENGAFFAHRRLDEKVLGEYAPPSIGINFDFARRVMKVVSSLKTLKSRDRNCQVVRRKGRLYVINKKNPRLKARQG